MSVPSEVKVINQGETYRSWKALADNPSYGPGFWDDFMKPVLSGTLAVSYYIPPLAPLGVAVSAGVGLAGLAMSELSNDSDVKKAGNEMLGVVLNAVEHREIAGNAVNGARAYNQISNYNSR